MFYKRLFESQWQLHVKKEPIDNSKIEEKNPKHNQNFPYLDVFSDFLCKIKTIEQLGTGIHAGQQQTN